MRTRSLLVVALFMGVAFLPNVPTTAADDGDLLRDTASNVIFPNNPCNASGVYGGVAVDPADGRLYYSVKGKPVLFVTTTAPPYSCLGAITVSGVPADTGFSRLAHDPHGQSGGDRVWAALDDGSGRVVGIRLATASVVATFTHPDGPGAITGLAVEQDSPHRNLATLAGASSGRWFDDSGNVVGSVSFNGVTSGIRGATAWKNALLIGENGYTVRFHDDTGDASGRAFRPHKDYADEFYQPQKHLTPYWWNDLALDDVTFVADGNVAIFTIQGSVFTVCVQNCESTQCVENCESTRCVEWDNEGFCIRTETYCDGEPGPCTDPPVRKTFCDGVEGECSEPPVRETRGTPRIRAHKIPLEEACPDPLYGCGGGDTCQDPTPPAVVAQQEPKKRVYVDNAPFSTAFHNPPLVYGDHLTLEYADPDGTEGKVLEIIGPLPDLPVVLAGEAGSTRWLHELDLEGVPAGSYAVTVIQTDLDDPCRAPTVLVTTIQVVRPHLDSYAQSVRVSGNLPTDWILGTPAQDPRQPLFGLEQMRVVDRNGEIRIGPAAGTDLTTLVGVDALAARAEYGPRESWALWNDADARTHAVGLVFTPPYGSVCPMSSPCFAIGQAETYHDVVESTAKASVHVDGQPSEASASSGLDTENLGTQQDRCAALGAALAAILPKDVCHGAIAFDGGTIEWHVGEEWTRTGSGWAEAYSNVLRITIDVPPYRGEIVIGEAYAAASLIGDEVLQGPPRFMLEADDFGAGTDAPDANGPVVPNGAYSGMFQGTDRTDSLRVMAEPLEKLQVVLSPAHRTEAYASPVPTAPTRQVTPRPITMELYDPDGALRDRTTTGVATLDARPAKVELNVDQPGAWTVVFHRVDTGVDSVRYAAQVAVTPLVHMPFDVSPAHPDAGQGCPATTPYPGAPLTGWLGPGEIRDTWRLPVANGDVVEVVLKPAYDLDGANFDLVVYGPTCNVVASSATAGDPPTPKGMPESVTLGAAATGAHTIAVVRANGIGNYVLEAATLDTAP